MTNLLPSTPPPAAPDASQRKGGGKLTGKMGGISLALTVLAFSAPLSVVSGFIPVTIIFGGEGAPFGFILATVILLLFSIGYVTMTKRVDKPGAFYAFVSRGLGKSMGLGAAFLAVASYLLVHVGNLAWFGICVQALIGGFGGPATPWYVWSLTGWAAISILGYFNIELSAKVLTVVMALEVGLIMIFSIFTLVQGGADGLSAAPLLPTEFLKGDIGITLLFAVLVFMGFEATALFRDEVRNPNITIPRATYGAVIFVGVLYTLACYALVTAFGSEAVEVANATPTEMFPMAVSQYVATVFVQIALVLVATSAIAAALSIHNVVARYAYNLGYDQALPHSLSRVHPKHHSPYIASNTVAVVTGAVLVLIAVLRLDEGLLYAQLIGMGSVGVLSLYALVSVAVITWFVLRRDTFPDNAFKTYVAPGIAAAALVIVVVLATLNFHQLVGGDPGQYTWLLTPLPIAMVAGIIVASYFRRNKPARYARLGRSDYAKD
ncbi:APC family permease [Leucobacter japonicus]|uniref:APC family permease n=1 Tax=Leucobacter japonicus TaxID=1461259 RepID=UPI0006A76C82|nr:APC family permease [Leucobacter japonicus]